MSMIHGIACERKRLSSKTIVITTPALPEAPCSVNLFFDVGVPGYSKAQATGRGLTKDEAVANLLGTIEATRAALAPVPVEPPVRSMPVRLSSLLACWLEHAWNKGEDTMDERLIKGAHLVRNGAVSVGNREGLMTVRSQVEPETWYDVENGQCTCKDWSNHVQPGKKWCCKHIIAVAMFTRLADPQ